MYSDKHVVLSSTMRKPVRYLATSCFCSGRLAACVESSRPSRHLRRNGRLLVRRRQRMRPPTAPRNQKDLPLTIACSYRHQPRRPSLQLLQSLRSRPCWNESQINSRTALWCCASLSYAVHAESVTGGQRSELLVT
eukprot:s436_g2.t1